MKLAAEDRETTAGRSIFRRNWYYLQAAGAANNRCTSLREPYAALLGLFGIYIYNSKTVYLAQSFFLIQNFDYFWAVNAKIVHYL
jgi:hypothetical protein